MKIITKPLLYKLPCGDWIPLDEVKAIIVNPDDGIRRAHVSIHLGEAGKLRVECVADSYERAQEIANALGQVVNQFRENWSPLK